MNKLVLLLTLSLFVLTTTSCNKEKTATVTVSVSLIGSSQKSDIKVSIEDATTGAQIEKGTTNADGKIEFKDLLPGTYTIDGSLWISSTVLYQGDINVQLSEKDDKDVTLILEDY